MTTHFVLDFSDHKEFINVKPEDLQEFVFSFLAEMQLFLETNNKELKLDFTENYEMPYFEIIIESKNDKAISDLGKYLSNDKNVLFGFLNKTKAEDELYSIIPETLIKQ